MIVTGCVLVLLVLVLEFALVCMRRLSAQTIRHLADEHSLEQSVGAVVLSGRIDIMICRLHAILLFAAVVPFLLATVTGVNTTHRLWP